MGLTARKAKHLLNSQQPRENRTSQQRVHHPFWANRTLKKEKVTPWCARPTSRALLMLLSLLTSSAGARRASGTAILWPGKKRARRWAESMREGFEWLECLRLEEGRVEGRDRLRWVWRSCEARKQAASCAAVSYNDGTLEPSPASLGDAKPSRIQTCSPRAC